MLHHSLTDFASSIQGISALSILPFIRQLLQLVIRWLNVFIPRLLWLRFLPAQPIGSQRYADAARLIGCTVRNSANSQSAASTLLTLRDCCTFSSQSR